MANNDFPVLDGIAPSWADVVIKSRTTGGVLVDTKDIAAINTSGALEVGQQRSASGGRVMKRTSGSSSYESSITFYKSGWQKFLRAIKAEAPLRGNQRRISLVHFNIQVQYTPEGDVEIYDKRIRGCRIAGFTENATEGTDATQVEVPLSVIEIVDMVDGEEIVLT